MVDDEPFCVSTYSLWLPTLPGWAERGHTKVEPRRHYTAHPQRAGKTYAADEFTETPMDVW